MSLCPLLGVRPSEAESLGKGKVTMKDLAGPFLSQYSLGNMGTMENSIVPSWGSQASESCSLHLESWLCTYLLWAENDVLKIGAVEEDWMCLPLHHLEPGSKSLPLLLSLLPEILKVLSKKREPRPERLTTTQIISHIFWKKTSVASMWKIISNRTIKDGKKKQRPSGEAGKWVLRNSLRGVN